MSIQSVNVATEGVDLSIRPAAATQQARVASQAVPVLLPQAVKQSVAPDALQQAIDAANKVFAHVRPDIKFVIEEDSNDVVIMLVEPETGDVINRYPTVQAVAISNAIAKAQEAIFDRQEIFRNSKDELVTGLLVEQRT